MVAGKDLAQQINAMPPEQVQELIQGLGSGIFTTILNAVLTRAMDWIKDPANQQLILAKLVELLSNFGKKN